MTSAPRDGRAATVSHALMDQVTSRRAAVGTAAAVANATYHATGVRVRDLPVTADRFVE